MLLEHGVQHQRAGSTIAAVADADDHKAHACLFDLVPVDVLLILGNIHTEGLAIFQHTVRIEVIEFIVDALDAGHRLVGGGAVIIGLAARGAPAGIHRFGLVQPAEQKVHQPGPEAVLAAKIKALGLGLVQRTGVQCFADLFRRQHHAVFRRVLVHAVLLGRSRLRGRCFRVLGGQLRGLGLQGGHLCFLRLHRRSGGLCFFRPGRQGQRCPQREGQCQRQRCRCAPDRAFFPERLFHAVLPNFIYFSDAAPQKRTAFHFSVALPVYTHGQGRVNCRARGHAVFFAARPAPEKCSKRNTSRARKSLHKAKNCRYFQQKCGFRLLS